MVPNCHSQVCEFLFFAAIFFLLILEDLGELDPIIADSILIYLKMHHQRYWHNLFNAF